MLTIDANTVNKALSFPKLIKALAQAFVSDLTVPPRLHYDMENPSASRETTLLMMPAWQAGDVAGIKLVTVAPDNSEKGLASILGTYILLDVETGQMKAMMDAPALTAKRTAAASALAASMLSRIDSETLMVIGTGTLSPQLISAHLSIRPINKVMVWGRNIEKAKSICQEMSALYQTNEIEFVAIDSIENHIAAADIISCATLSKEPLIKGEWLVPGQHLDMVGAYRPDMREMDDECLKRGRIYVDNMSSAIRETGDLAIPLAEGIIEESEIEADLFALCEKSKGELSNPENSIGRKNQDITVFKSVGHALEDLAAAKLVFEYVK